MRSKKGFFKIAAIAAVFVIPAAAFAANSGSYTDGSIDGGAYIHAPAGNAGFGGTFNMTAGSSTWRGMTSVGGGGSVNGVTNTTHHGGGSVSGTAASGGYADVGHGFSDSGTYSNAGSTSTAFGRGASSNAAATTNGNAAAMHGGHLHL